MVKIVFIAVCLIAMLSGSSTSTNIECSFGIGGYNVVGSIYQCAVNNNPKISTEESAQISGISGTHQSSKTNDDVLGFRADSKTIQVFPKGLYKFFKNIKFITIQSCQLKEIHQSDLKVFPNLVYFYLNSNQIEVIEEGLFDFNPNLELVRFEESKIIHIDPNVFDNLNKLSYFYFSSVPCVAQSISDSRERVQSAIKIVKSKCSNSNFLSLEQQIENLEVESRALSSEEFYIKLAKFEKNSKFLKFRPLNSKVQNLKVVGYAGAIGQLQESQISLLNSCQKCITDKFEDLNASQCGLKYPIDELKTSQSSLQITLGSIKSSVNDQASKLDQIVNIQNQLSTIETKFSSQTNSINTIDSKLNSMQNDHKAMLSDLQNSQKKIGASIANLNLFQNDSMSAINEIRLTQDSLKASQDESLANITSKLNELKKDIKSTQDETKLSLTDIEVKLSDHSSFQTDFKDALVKIRTMQNEMKLTLNDVKSSKNDDFEVKLTDLSDKVESLEGHFVEFEGKLAEKFANNEKGLAIKLHKMSTNFDEKVKGIEKRMMKKFEDILEEKFRKFLNEKLENLINAREGNN